MPQEHVMPRPSGLHGELAKLTRMQWYLARMAASAYQQGASEAEVTEALNAGLEQATFNDAYWVPEILPEHSDHNHRVFIHGRALGCCYICGYIGTDLQSYCPNCQPELEQGEGDFFSCTLRDIYQSFPFFTEQPDESQPDTA